MFKRFQISLILLVAVANGPTTEAEISITPDVVYGHKFGMAMTFDVFTPTENANGGAVLFVVSGGWFSRWSPPEQNIGLAKPLTDKGFTPKIMFEFDRADKSVALVRLGETPDRLDGP